MGTVYAEITLRNAGDVTSARRGFIKEPEIRQSTVQAMVDTGAGTLVISEAMRLQLGLEVIRERYATLANETRELCKVTEPVEIHWKDRSTAVQALVLQRTCETLLGAIPLEDMDLIVDPARRELTGAHGDEVYCMIK